jgi:hypothetical protein
MRALLLLPAALGCDQTSFPAGALVGFASFTSVTFSSNTAVQVGR